MIKANLVPKLFVTLTLLISPSIASAQSIALSIGSGSATAGGTVALPINLTSTGGAPQTTGLNGPFNYSSDITGVTVVAGLSTASAGKSLSCSGNNCLIVGFNTSVIADGPVAIATFQIAPNPSSSAIPIQLTNVVASTAGGVSIPSNGTSGSISLPSVSLPSVSLSSLHCSRIRISTPLGLPSAPSP